MFTKKKHTFVGIVTIARLQKPEKKALRGTEGQNKTREFLEPFILIQAGIFALGSFGADIIDGGTTLSSWGT